jgi:phospholipid transport system transporter-binding protein
MQAPKQITMASAPGALAFLSQGLDRGETEIDLSTCQDFDSALLATLLELRRVGNQRGNTLRYTNPPANLTKLSTLYGVDDLLFAGQSGGAASLHPTTT